MPLDTSMKMPLLCKDWRRVTDIFTARKVESGMMKVVRGTTHLHVCDGAVEVFIVGPGRTTKVVLGANDVSGLASVCLASE